MQFVLEMIFHVIVEILFYKTGQFLAPFLFSQLKIEAFRRQKIMQSSFKHQGFTYRRGKKHFLYTETIALIGLLAWLFAGLAWFGLSSLPVASAFQSQLL